jgi:predicted DNA-binding WGR domain protein
VATRLTDKMSGNQEGAYATSYPLDRLAWYTSNNHMFSQVATAKVNVTKFWSVKVEGHFIDGYGRSYWRCGRAGTSSVASPKFEGQFVAQAPTPAAWTLVSRQPLRGEESPRRRLRVCATTLVTGD